MNNDFICYTNKQLICIYCYCYFCLLFQKYNEFKHIFLSRYIKENRVSYIIYNS